MAICESTFTVSLHISAYWSVLNLSSLKIVINFNQIQQIVLKISECIETETLLVL